MIVLILEFHNIIEYWVDGTQKPIFQTCEKEKGKVVFQMVIFF